MDSDDGEINQEKVPVYPAGTLDLASSNGVDVSPTIGVALPPSER